MKLTNFPFYLALLIPGIISCKKKEECIPSPDISQVRVDLRLDRVDVDLINASTPEEMSEVLQKHEMFSEIFLLRSQYPQDSVFGKSIYNLFQDPHIDTLYREITRVFGDLSGIRQELEEAFRRLKTYYPDYKIPRIETVISGLSKDMYVSDTLIIIGLDFYLGEGAKYRPIDIPDYILKRYQPRNLIPNTLMFISQGFNVIDRKDNTLLADMIFYGKAFQFTKQLLPCVPDSILLGYSPGEMQNIQVSQEIIWANFIQNELLYTSDQVIKDKFISERPRTYEIGENCPGRIGRWIGWEIVKAFLAKEPGLSLRDMMENSDSQEIFSTSRFKPRSGGFKIR